MIYYGNNLQLTEHFYNSCYMIQKSMKNNELLMTQLDLVKYSTQWLWNVHKSLEL